MNRATHIVLVSHIEPRVVDGNPIKVVLENLAPYRCWPWAPEGGGQTAP